MSKVTSRMKTMQQLYLLRMNAHNKCRQVENKCILYEIFIVYENAWALFLSLLFHVSTSLT